jgi:hypothetical protein
MCLTEQKLNAAKRNAVTVTPNHSPSCHPGAHACGGHADRWYGIFVAFWLAVLTKRRLLLDIPAPVGLDTFLVPNEIDWRVTDELRKVGW